MSKPIKNFIKNNLLSSFLLISLVSCVTAHENEGYIYHSDIEAFITKATIVYTRDKITIKYPKYDCKKVKYNIENFSKKELHKVCAELDSFFENQKISFPNKECSDKYTIKNDKIYLLNTKHPCYGFSKDLNQIIKSSDNTSVQQIQFQSKPGLFQGEF